MRYRRPGSQVGRNGTLVVQIELAGLDVEAEKFKVRRMELSGRASSSENQ